MDSVDLVVGPEQDNGLDLVLPMSMSRDVLMLDLQCLIYNQSSLFHIVGWNNIYVLVEAAMNV
jgi:hypothetical protein